MIGPVQKSLAQFRSIDAPVLSVYFDVPADPGELKGVQSTIHTLLKPMEEMVDSRELSHAARESVRNDIAAIDGIATRSAALQGRGVAVFACSEAGLYQEVVLGAHLRQRAVADETPYLGPLLAAIDEAHRYLVVVVESAESWFYELYLQELEETETLQEPSWFRPGKRSAHDIEAQHVDNRTETLIRKHFHATATAAERLMGQTEAELLILGGHQDTIAEFHGMLPKDLQPKLAGTFVIEPQAMTPAKVREQALPVVEAYERAEEQQLVATAYDRAAAGGRGAIGFDWCVLATEEEAVEVLLVHDDTEIPGRVCDNCGWLGLEGDECPVDGSPTRATADVIDDMAAEVVSASGRVEHVYADTSLENDIVGAILRFPLPPPR